MAKPGPTSWQIFAPAPNHVREALSRATALVKHAPGGITFAQKAYTL
jgi:hypothetical protein